MARFGTVEVDVEPGPVLRTALDVVDFAIEVLDLLPSWNNAERDELVSRANGLIDRCNTGMKGTLR